MTITEIRTADGNRVAEGDVVFNYYDRKWGRIRPGSIDHEGWFTVDHEDGTNALLNGERISVADVQGRTTPRLEVPGLAPEIPGHEAARRPVELTHAEANVVLGALLRTVAGTDVADANTWHGGLGADLCEGCTALVNIRPAGHVAAVDALRP